jgi:hypothetical protein
MDNANRSNGNGSAANRSHGNGSAANSHSAPVLEIDDSLTFEVGRVLSTAIEQAHGAITLATPEHQQAIDLHLESSGIDVRLARARRQYLSFDAADMLTMISINGVPDKEQFGVVLAAIVEPMSLRHERVSIFGELGVLLRAADNGAAARQLEEWWTEMTHILPMLLYCTYPNGALTETENVDTFRRTCLAQCKVLETPGLNFHMTSNGPIY